MADGASTFTSTANSQPLSEVEYVHQKVLLVFVINVAC